jgi:hypothetical protein
MIAECKACEIADNSDSNTRHRAPDLHYVVVRSRTVFVSRELPGIQREKDCVMYGRAG